MLAAWMTLAHLSVSAAMKLLKSAGDIGIGVLPRAARRCTIVGSWRPALICAFSLVTISPGVLVGAPTPCHVLASKPGTDSPTVGTSGSAAERCAVVTASGRTWPALIAARDSGSGLK